MQLKRIAESLADSADAWSNPLIYPASEAPHYKYGWAVSLSLYISVVIVILGLRVYDLKVIRYVSMQHSCRRFC